MYLSSTQLAGSKRKRIHEQPLRPLGTSHPERLDNNSSFAFDPASSPNTDVGINLRKAIGNHAVPGSELLSQEMVLRHDQQCCLGIFPGQPTTLASRAISSVGGRNNSATNLETQFSIEFQCTASSGWGLCIPSCSDCPADLSCTATCATPCFGDPSCDVDSLCQDPDCQDKPCFETDCASDDCIDRCCPDNHCLHPPCTLSPCLSSGSPWKRYPMYVASLDQLRTSGYGGHTGLKDTSGGQRYLREPPPRQHGHDITPLVGSREVTPGASDMRFPFDERLRAHQYCRLDHIHSQACTCNPADLSRSGSIFGEESQRFQNHAHLIDTDFDNKNQNYMPITQAAQSLSTLVLEKNPRMSFPSGPPTHHPNFKRPLYLHPSDQPASSHAWQNALYPHAEAGMISNIREPQPQKFTQIVGEERSASMDPPSLGNVHDSSTGGETNQVVELVPHSPTHETFGARAAPSPFTSARGLEEMATEALAPTSPGAPNEASSTQKVCRWVLNAGGNGLRKVICSKVCNSDEELYEHIRAEHTMLLKNKDFRCRWDECKDYFEKDYGQRGKLERHIKGVHTDYREYECDWEGCNYRGKNPQSLKHHKLTHTDEKPHKCQFCNYATKTQHALKDHERIHTGQKKYVCSICGYRASESSNLNKHKKTHEARVFKCTHPGCTFKPESRWDNFRRHLKNSGHMAHMLTDKAEEERYRERCRQLAKKLVAEKEARARRERAASTKREPSPPL